MAIPFIDLCSGIGGFHSGLVNTGHYRCVGHAEIDKNAEKAYNAIYGEEGGLNYGDLRTINPRKLPHFDLLCGGFPCQSFSVAGRRLGFRDTRGTVFFEIARILAEKRPPFLLLENVLGLLSHDSGRTLNTIFSALVEMGYTNRKKIFFAPIRIRCQSASRYPQTKSSTLLRMRLSRKRSTSGTTELPLRKICSRKRKLPRKQ